MARSLQQHDIMVTGVTWKQFVRLLYKHFFPLRDPSWTSLYMFWRKLIFFHPPPLPPLGPPENCFHTLPILLSSLVFMFFHILIWFTTVWSACREIKILVETVSLLCRPILPYVAGIWFITRLRNCFNSICGFLPPGLHNIKYILYSYKHSDGSRRYYWSTRGTI